MLDKHSYPLANSLAQRVARPLARLSWLSADGISLSSFILSLFCCYLIFRGYFLWALPTLLLARSLDLLDGCVARIKGSTLAGGFLDICLDFISYSAFIFAFALYDKQQNALAAALLICSFVGTGTSFLAFAIAAAKLGLVDIRFDHKSFYYMNGLVEGTETILFFVIMLIFPRYFAQIAYFFAAICWLSSAVRIYFGWKTLKKQHSSDIGSSSSS